MNRNDNFEKPIEPSNSGQYLIFHNNIKIILFLSFEKYTAIQKNVLSSCNLNEKNKRFQFENAEF